MGINEDSPARLAVMRVVTVPANRARRMSWERSPIRVGAIAPIPPSCMPIELRLAKPQSAYVAMISERFYKNQQRDGKTQMRRFHTPKL